MVGEMPLRERLGITLLLQQERPTKVEQELLCADVRSVLAAADSTSHEGSSRVNKVALDTRRVCFHKAASGVKEPQARLYGHEPFGVLINESAAWMIAKALGQPFAEWVPTTVIRSIWPEDPALAGGFGAFSTRIDGDTEVEQPWQDPAYCDPAAFWDALIGQQDRHYGNYRFDVRAQRPPLGLIDNGYAFAAPTRWNTYHPHRSIFVHHRRLAGRLALSADELDWLGLLRADGELLGDLSDILAPEQSQALLARIRRMADPPHEILGVLEF
jgi:hypothetical protein